MIYGAAKLLLVDAYPVCLSRLSIRKHANKMSMMVWIKCFGAAKKGPACDKYAVLQTDLLVTFHAQYAASVSAPRSRVTFSTLETSSPYISLRRMQCIIKRPSRSSLVHTR